MEMFGIGLLIAVAIVGFYVAVKRHKENKEAKMAKEKSERAKADAVYRQQRYLDERLEARAKRRAALLAPAPKTKTARSEHREVERKSYAYDSSDMTASMIGLMSINNQTVRDDTPSFSSGGGGGVFDGGGASGRWESGGDF